MLIAGVDEAGRGPCLGPMVLAIATIEKEKELELMEIGVRDSKELSPAKRVEQLPQIKRIVQEFSSVHIPPKELDALMDWKSLNEIEAMKIGGLLNNLKKKPDVVFIDSPDVIQENFGKRIKKYLTFETKLKTEHKADSNYLVVGAASIIAKVERDHAIEILAKKFGKIGSGYTHDPHTREFLFNYVKQNKHLPSCCRKSWSTSRQMLDAHLQQKLF
ncbi:ribonuclease HII [Candidatus Micrarchaeota archaeon]|nr:ribonuclease HII [Candidatus Micrarchaeota archaeon]MBU1931016.1 ribonuclease HII [Candidatus Micrarchaeota archaeon]